MLVFAHLLLLGAQGRKHSTSAQTKPLWKQQRGLAGLLSRDGQHPFWRWGWVAWLSWQGRSPAVLAVDSSSLRAHSGPIVKEILRERGLLWAQLPAPVSVIFYDKLYWSILCWSAWKGFAFFLRCLIVQWAQDSFVLNINDQLGQEASLFVLNLFCHECVFFYPL